MRVALKSAKNLLTELKRTD